MWATPRFPIFMLRIVIQFVSVAGILLSAVPCAAMEPVAQPNPSSAVRHLEKLGSVSDSFSRELETAARTIPDAVWQLVTRAGWRVGLVEYVVDAVPSLRGAPPRGWPAGSKWDNTDAVHLTSSKQLIIAEKRHNQKGEIVTCTRVGGVLRHEFGHAFDVVTGGQYLFQSLTPEFLAAYQLDVAAMSQDRRRELQYYLQDSDAGHQETFAEAFAALFGGGSDTAHRNAFEDSFGHTIDYVRRAVTTATSRPIGDPALAEQSQPTSETVRGDRIRERLGRVRGRAR